MTPEQKLAKRLIKLATLVMGDSEEQKTQHLEGTARALQQAMSLLNDLGSMSDGEDAKLFSGMSSNLKSMVDNLGIQRRSRTPQRRVRRRVRMEM